MYLHSTSLHQIQLATSGPCCERGHSRRREIREARERPSSQGMPHDYSQNPSQACVRSSACSCKLDLLETLWSQHCSRVCAIVSMASCEACASAARHLPLMKLLLAGLRARLRTTTSSVAVWPGAAYVFEHTWRASWRSWELALRCYGIMG